MIRKKKIVQILVDKLTLSELGLEINMDFNLKTTNDGSSFDNYTYVVFYQNIVKQNLKEFYNDELNQRKAINACISLYHMADRYIPNDKPKRKTFYKKIPYNKILECITNGTKHCNKEKKFKTGKKEGSYIPRDYLKIKAGSCWVSDHAQIDVAVDFNGTTYFPWVTVFRDVKTSKWLGWFLHLDAPNSDHIFQTFYYAV